MGDHSSSTARYSSGCELFTATANTSSNHCSPLQQIRRAYQHSSTYFSIIYLDERRGYGAIAERDIPKHTLILEEPPLIPCDVLQFALEEHDAGRLACHEDDAQFLRKYFDELYGDLELDDDVKELEVQTLIDLFWHMHDQYVIDAEGEFTV